MAYDHFCFLRIKIAEFDRLAGYKHVTGSVEAISADFIFLIVLIRYCIEICFLRHGHAKTGIPNGHILLVGHNRLAGLDTHKISRIVQRSKVETLFDNPFYIFIHNNRLTVFGTRMKHTMTDCRDLVRALHHAMHRILKRIQNQSDRNLVIRHRLLGHIFVLASRLVSQYRTFNTDSLTQTLCYYTLVRHINQLIFQRRASAVDN